MTTIPPKLTTESPEYLTDRMAYEKYVPLDIAPQDLLSGVAYLQLVERVLTDPTLENPYSLLRAIKRHAEQLVADHPPRASSDSHLPDHFYLHCPGCGHWHALTKLRRVDHPQSDEHNLAYGCPRTGIVVLSYKDTYD